MGVVMYSGKLLQVGEADTTRFPHGRQPKTTKIVNTEDENTFVGRLRKALNVKTNVKLARQLEVSPSAVTDYAKGRAYPPVAKLVEIARKAHVSLDWLLLDEGEKPVGPLDFLEPRMRSAVEALAEVMDKSVEELVAELLSGALDGLAADLVRDHRSLRPSEMRQLKVLMRLLEIDEVAEVNHTRDIKAS